jgi:hypothetical protein
MSTQGGAGDDCSVRVRNGIGERDVRPSAATMLACQMVSRAPNTPPSRGSCLLLVSVKLRARQGASCAPASG